MFIQWQPTCCAWHGDYAEHRALNGDMVRLKKAPNIAGILVMRFNAQNQRVDADYVLMPEAEALALLA